MIGNARLHSIGRVRSVGFRRENFFSQSENRPDYYRRIEAAKGPSKDYPLRPRNSHADKIRQEVRERGESIVSRAEARTLWTEELAAADKWNAIAQLAISEHWSFTFFPNGDVRFAPFDSKE